MGILFALRPLFHWFGLQCSAALLWPRAEKFAVTLYESLTFELCKVVAGFIGLVFPHPANGIRVGVFEAVQESHLSFEMVIQRRPLIGDRWFHSTKSPAHVCSAEQ